MTSRSKDRARLMRLLCAASVAATTGCVDPIEPLASIYDDAALAGQVSESDGIDGVAVRQTGFVHGREVTYWSFGRSPVQAMPIYRLCRPEGDEACVAIEHPAIVDLLPGEEGYTAYTQLHWVELPAGWTGRLASFAEVDAYLEEHALPAPRSTSRFLHCLIAGDDATIEVSDGVELRAETPIYVRGMEARCFDFTATRENSALYPSGEMFVRNVYALTREGETETLSESRQMLDLNGDGDQNDSNNIFGVGLEDPDYTPLWRAVGVTVPADLPSIESTPAYTSTEDMFDVSPDYVITPRDGQIIEFELRDVFLNCPLQSADGAL